MKSTVKAGDILIAQPFMDDGNFKRSVIGIADHGKEGSVGFILNRPIKVQLTEILDTVSSDEDFKFFFGGPVAKDTIHYVHNVGDLLEDSIPIKNGMYWGGNFEKLIILVNNGVITPKNIRFYVGYSGWSYGQLEDELKSNSWIISEWFANYTFKTKAKDLWSQALGHKGDSYSVIANIPRSSNNN